MTLIISRIREMFWLFGAIIPVDSMSNKETIKASFGHGLEEIIPDFMIVLSQFAEKYPEDFEMFMQFFVEALGYMRGDREKHPAIEGMTEDDYRQEMLIQLGRYTKQGNRMSVEKYQKLQENAPETELEPDR